MPTRTEVHEAICGEGTGKLVVEALNAAHNVDVRVAVAYEPDSLEAGVGFVIGDDYYITNLREAGNIAIALRACGRMGRGRWFRQQLQLAKHIAQTIMQIAAAGVQAEKRRH